MKKTLVILGHPDVNSLCGTLARSYVEAARTAGAEVRELYLAELDFDPVLWHGYHRIQPLESDLVAAQTLIRWAQHLVFVYPNWWGSMPALLKGFFDRVFLPEFAFRYRENSPFWDKLLTGRSAHLIVTMDTPGWYYRWVYRMPGHNEMKRAILGFCGIRPVRVSQFAVVRNSSRGEREKWIARVRCLAMKP